MKGITRLSLSAGATRLRHKRRRGFLATMTVVFTLILSMVAIAVPADVSAVTCTTPLPCLPGSTFESADGNFVVDTAGDKDWASVASSASLSKATDVASGSTDNSFGQGTKEDDTAVTVVTGTIPPNKDDLTHFAAYSELVGGNTYLYLLWERTNNLGSAHEDFEINQKEIDTNGCLSTAGACTLNRTDGDLLITFDFGGSGFPTLTLYTWLDGSTGTCFSAKSQPCWGNAETLGSSVANGAVYTGTATITGPIFAESLGTGTFGEAGVNMTAAGIFPAGQCKSFGSAWLKSRSSGSSFTSAMKDFIAPIPAHINNCATINIHKALQNAPANNTDSFSYTTTGTGLGSFSLPNPPGTFDKSFPNINPGSYSVTESTPLPSGWNFVKLECTSDNASNTTSVSSQTASITIAAAGTVDCTFTNHYTNSPTIATTLSGASVNVGSTVHDSATLSGASANAGGSVTYKVYTNNTCTTLFANAGTKAVTNGVVTDSDGVTFNAAGTYYWQAVYSGDSNNNGATSTCTDEKLVVNPVGTGITTTLSQTTIAVGSTAYDTSSLTGTVTGITPTGSVTYKVYTDNTCTTLFANAGTKTLNADGTVPNSDSVTFNAAGTYYWQASYSGDSNYNASTSTCQSEQLDVSKASPTIATTLSATTAAIGAAVHDSATLSGATANAGGSVTYTVYTNNTCTANPVAAGTKTVTNGSVPDSNAVSFSAAGTYYWQASYSGDGNNNSATSACQSEILTVNPNSPTIATTLSATTAAIGAAVHDSATLSGATANAGGSVTYTVYTDDQCTANPVDAGTKAVTNGVVTDSNAISFSTAGTYYWQAVYSGDGNNNGATSDCQSEILTVSPNTPGATTAQSLIPDDSATLTGATSNAGGSFIFELHAPGDGQCLATPVFTQTVTVNGNGTYSTTNKSQVTPYVASGAGTWNWLVKYTGDANNSAFTIACGVEHFTIVDSTP